MLGDEQKSIPGFTRRILSLSPAEIGELLSFLFIKMQYRIGETAQEDNLLYLDLIQPSPAQAQHTLACWTGEKKSLDTAFLQGFLRDAPIKPSDGTSYVRGFILSPYEFSPDFQSAAGNFGITLFDGPRLADLLVQHEFTYYLPEVVEEAAPVSWKKLIPFLLIPVILIYAFFAYETFGKHEKNHGNLPGLLGIPQGQSAANGPSVSLLTPSNAAPLQNYYETYKRADVQEKLSIHEIKPEKKPALQPAPQPQPTETAPRPSPQPSPIESPKVKTQTRRPVTRKPAHSSHKAHSESNVHIRFVILHKYQDVVDLEEKYYLIARDLAKHGQRAEAKIYYKRYLKVAPGGGHAAEARDAISR